MTIAIDFVGTNIESGTKTYNINFCNELSLIDLNEDIIVYLCNNYFKQIDLSKKKNSRIKFIVKPNFFANIFFRLLWMQFFLPFDLKIKGVRKLYSPMNFCPIFSKFFNIKIVLALHSNLPWIFFNLMPGNFLRNIITKKMMELSIFAAEILIVNSYFAKEEISSLLNIPKNKIKVIYLGVDKKYLSNECSKNYLNNYDYNQKYILSVLSCVKYHNILNLLKAFNLLIKETKLEINFVLVLQILDKNYYKILKSYIQKNFKENKVIIKSNVESKYLPNLYKYSQLYVFTSYCEVFGLTSLEAMSQGCPILISRTSVLPEINSDAADYFNPDDILEIKNKFKKILIDDDFKNNLILNGSKHHKKFNWSKNVLETINIIT